MSKSQKQHIKREETMRWVTNTREVKGGVTSNGVKVKKSETKTIQLMLCFWQLVSQLIDT